MSIGAVVVTYKTQESQLARCLGSLRQEGVSEVVIVNNNNNNLGFAAAANKGAFDLSNDMILFLNPDAYLDSGALLLAERLMAGDEQTGIVGLLMEDLDGEIETRSFGDVVTPWTILSRHRPKKFRHNSRPLDVGWVSGGVMLVRRKVFLAVGGFDQRFFLYWEDVDFCRRIKLAGWKVMLLPTIGAIHQKGASLRDKQKKTQIYDQSADKYFNKHYPKLVWLGYKAAKRLYRLFSPRVR